MIKSAHLCESVSRQAGGLFDAVMRLAQTEQKLGATVKAFGLRDDSTAADLPAWSPVEAVAFAPGWPKGIGAAPGFFTELENFAPDISHTHGLWLYPSIAEKNYARKTKRPYLISPHGMLDPWALKNSRWKKQIAWRLFEAAHLRGARCLRALCQSEADSIRQLGLKNEIAVIPNGIDLTESGKQKAENGNAPWSDAIGPDKKVLLFLSRIHPKKGLVNLLKAWPANRQSAIGNRQSDEWVLAIAGWEQGGHETELKQLCVERNISFADIRTPTSKSQLPASVVFLGPQFNAAKSACYHHCDAFVLPSFSEGLPMVVLEAWANAKPVLMTPECNLPEGFQAGAAVKIEATETSIAAGLQNLFALSDAERATMGGHARALVESRFTWTQVGRQMRAVHEWILGGGPQPDCLLRA
jgi:glycosyltransferase involved in cell wall biosynthesis